MSNDTTGEKKHKTQAGQILTQLGELSSFYALADSKESPEDCFNYPLKIIQKTLGFDAAVLYKVTNVVNNRLMLEVVRLMDPKGFRTDLAGKKRFRLFLDNPDPIYVNEVNTFKTRRVSSINIPGAGCDITGYVYVPEEFGSSYLFGGDFYGRESSITTYDISAFEIMCNFLSTILIKGGYEHEAIHDHLTGLMNSRRIRLEVAMLLKRLARQKDPKACVVMADIDYFKKINDTYGHLQGDLVLKRVARIFENSMRQYVDMVGRYGGEEFLLIFDNTDEKTCRSIVERIRQEIESTKFLRIDESGKQDPTRFFNLTMSFGIAGIGHEKASLSEPSQDRSFERLSPEEWINRADKALYHAKQNGRNQASIYPS